MIGKPEDEARAIYDAIRPRGCRSYSSLPSAAKAPQPTAGLHSNSTMARAGIGTAGKHRILLGLRAQGPARTKRRSAAFATPDHPWYRRSLRRAEHPQGDERPDPGRRRAAHQTLDAGLLARRHRAAAADARRARLLGGVAASRASWSRSWACEAVKLEVPMRVDLKFGRSWGDAKHTWEELTGAAPAPKQAARPPSADLESEPEPRPNAGAQARAAAFGTGHGSPENNATPAGRSPCGEEGPAAARHAVADDPQNEGGSGGARIHARPNLQHDSWTGVGAFTKIAIRSSAHTRATTATAAGDRAHQVHQGRRAAHQANLPVSRRHAGERRLGLRDGPRHGRARQSRRRRCARRVDRRPDAVTGDRARHPARRPAGQG